MDISTFVLQNATIEVRYNNTYLIWDKIGSYWNKLAEKWPGLTLFQSSPNIISFTLDKKFQLTVEIGRTHIVQNMPETNLKELSNLADDIILSVQRNFEVSSFNRLGFRTIYLKKYTSKKEACEEFLALNLIKSVTKKHFNIEGKVTNPAMGVTWEDDDLGARVQIGVISQTLEFDAPAQVTEVESKKIEWHGIQVDIDYYTLKPVPSGKFIPSEWIEQSHRAIRRDISAYLGG